MTRASGPKRYRPGPAPLVTGSAIVLTCVAASILAGWPWAVVAGLLLLFCVAITLVILHPGP